MHAVHNLGSVFSHVVGRASPQDAPLGGVRVHDVRLQSFQHPFEFVITDVVFQRRDRPAQFFDHVSPVLLPFRLRKELPFGSQGRSGDKGDIVSALGEESAGDQGVFLGAAHDKTSYDVNNLQRSFP